MLNWNKSSFLQKLVAAWMRILLTFFISNVSWVLANITSESSYCFQKGNRNSGHRLSEMVCPSFWEGYYMLIYTHCWELTNSVGSHGSSSLLFVMKVMVCHFVSDSDEVRTALIVVLPLIVVEISLQLHQASLLPGKKHHWLFWSQLAVWRVHESHDHPHLSCSCVVYCSIQETLVVTFVRLGSVKSSKWLAARLGFLSSCVVNWFLKTHIGDQFGHASHRRNFTARPVT